MTSAPDYRVACLWMGFVNLLMVFVTIWAVWGLVAVGMLAYAMHLGINRLALRKANREAKFRDH
ncbi:hypothetical protein [Cognatishimia sp.]|uniref:hypothetical protein n=1 Tax=Cognatishimia sp. TaxID=2211648 RepID=UPI0035190099